MSDDKSSVKGRMSNASPRKSEKHHVLCWMDPVILDVDTVGPPNPSLIRHLAENRFQFSKIHATIIHEGDDEPLPDL